MDRITRFSLRNGAAVALAALLLVAGGLWSAGQLKKESMPDVTIPVVIVTTPYPGAAPTDVYDDVTEPLETAVRGVPGVKHVNAQSGDSFSAIIVEFDFSQDMEKAEADVNKAVSSVGLPEKAVSPDVSRIGFNSAPIMRVAITAASGSGAELTTHARDHILPALSGIEGVGEARLAVDTKSVVNIELDPKKLEKHGLTAEGVVQQLQAANLSFPVGAVDLGSTTEPIRVGGTIDSVEDLKGLRVAVYPDQGDAIGDAFGQIGQGMGALAKGMGQGFSAVGEGMGQLGQATGEVGMQVGLVNAIQQTQGQLVEARLAARELRDRRDALLTEAEDSPDAIALEEQITALESKAIPGMEQAIEGMQKEIARSQRALGALAANKSASSGAQRAPAGNGDSSANKEPSKQQRVKTVTLGKLAKITYGPSGDGATSRANGMPAALIDIVKTQDGNTVLVSAAVKEALDELSKGLPKGAEYTVAYDASAGIESSVAGMVREGLLGALFAVVVILLFLRNGRATLIAAVSIPLSILTALVLLRATGVTLNAMTLGGLTVAIGRVVDDSIVVIENVFQHMQRGDRRDPELIRAATAEVAGAITSSTLATVAVFVPLGLVTGVIGKLFQPFAITVGVALLASLLVAVSVVPLLARWMLLHGTVPVLDRESKLTSWYRGLLDRALSHRWAVVAGAMALFIASLALIPIIGTGFVPETSEKYINISVSHPQGTKPRIVDATARRIESALEKYDEVEHHQSTIGGAGDFGFEGAGGGSNSGSILVKLSADAETEKVISAMKADTKSLATDGVGITFQSASASGVDSTLEVLVSGPDIASVRAGSEVVQKELSSFEGLENVTSNLSESRPQLVVDVDQAKASKHGMNAAMVAETVRRFVAEDTVGTMKVDGRLADVTYGLKLDPVSEARELRNLKLATPLGSTVRLSRIATVAETGSPLAVLTQDGQQFAAVSGRITERDAGAVIAAVRTELAGTKLPAGVSFEISGAAEQMTDSFSQLGMAMLVAVAAVFLVMVVAFGEATAPLAILFSLPLAVVGGLLGLLVAGVPLDIPAMIGALMLIGIVVANAIVLVDRAKQLQRDGLERRAALVEAGAGRMRPILMTALSTVMALVPLALGLAEGSLVSQSLGVIVIGGLTTSTLLTLIVVPIAYDLLEGAKERILARASAPAQARGRKAAEVALDRA